MGDTFFVSYGSNQIEIIKKLDYEKLLAILNHYNEFKNIDNINDEKIRCRMWDFFITHLKIFYNIEVSECGTFIGFHPLFLEEQYPETKLKDIYKVTANLFNNLITSDLTENDICFIETEQDF